MIRIPYADVAAKIREKTGLTQEQVDEKVQAKLTQLAGLVSKEGAASIVASELGVKVMEQSGKIKDIFPGMRSVETAGKVVEVYEAREFSRADGSASKVCSVLFGDETGVIRLVGWGDHAGVLSGVSQGMVIRVVNAYCRENSGRKELHCGDQARLTINPPGLVVGEVKPRDRPGRKQIKDITEQDESVEIMGTVVQVFDPRFFSVCPSCGKKVQEADGTTRCVEHGIVQPDHSCVLNVVMDDGSDNVRCVFFRNQAVRLLSATDDQLQAYRIDPTSFEPVKNHLLGEQFKLTGKPKKNDFHQRVELVISTVVPANAQEELARLGGTPLELPPSPNVSVPVNSSAVPVQASPIQVKSEEESI